jgi:hypothetical protein
MRSLEEEASPRRPSRDDRDDRDDASLSPFAPPPSVLSILGPALSVGAAAAPVSAHRTSLVLAEVAAMADQMVTSMSLGRVGRDGHALKMKLSLGKRGSLDVNLALRGDDLEIDLTPEHVAHADIEALARALEQELGVRVSLR